MVNCDPWSDFAGTRWCSFMDTWGPYIWLALAVAALFVAVWAVKRFRPPAPRPTPMQQAEPSVRPHRYSLAVRTSLVVGYIFLTLVVLYLLYAFLGIGFGF